jgi:hypothetical protein
MARKFLTPIDLNKLELQNARIQNLASDPSTPVAGQIYYNTVDSQLKYYNGGASAWQLIGQSNEQLEDAVADLITAGQAISVAYDDEAGTLTIVNTGVTSIAGTENKVNVSASAGTVTIDLPSVVDADISGIAASATYAITAETANSVAADSVSLGTDTTGDYVASATAGTGIDISGTGEGASLTISNTGVVSISGTENEVNVSASAGAVTIGLPDNVTIGGDLSITGNLTVSGSTTYLNTQTLTVEDNIILLNSGVEGSPTTDSGIEIERGSSDNVSLLWDESEVSWSATNDGTNYHKLARKYVDNVGDVSNTQFAITHNLGTRDVTVQVFDNSTYDSVEVDVVRTSTSVVTISFAIAPALNAYRVVITG